MHADSNQTDDRAWNEIDLADKILVLDPEDIQPSQADSSNLTERQASALKHLNEMHSTQIEDRVCFAQEVITISTCLLIAFICSIGLIVLWRSWRKNKL